MIYQDIYKLTAHLEVLKYNGNKIILTSGYYAPMHIGHLYQINASKALYENSVLVVIVNSDRALIAKKGKSFMPEQERLEIVDNLKAVDYSIIFDDGSPYVSGAIAILKPTIFTKGGDRSDASKVPEVEICNNLNIEVLYGIGGFDKKNSSTNLIGY